MSFPLNQATIGPVLASAVATDLVTSVPAVHSIEYVPSRTAEMLTKRRAVDFCRVATAMCRCPVPFVA